MKDCDIRKLIKFVRAHHKICVIGTMPIAISNIVIGKECELNDATLVVINDQSSDVDAIKLINHNCTIFVCDVSPFLEEYTDTSPNIQCSRRMLIDGVREDAMTLIHSIKAPTSNRTDPITIFLVLRTGGDVFNYRYVNACVANIKNNITYPHEIVCITDNPKNIVGIDRIVYMKHNWSKWWGKIELFRPDITGNKHCLYLDLDTICLDNIDNICKLPEGFYGIRDFYHLDTFQTGVMKWEVSDSSMNIYNSFIIEDFSKYINKGDHEWIGAHVHNAKFLQDYFPNEICSYKKNICHITQGYMKPTILCFHGTPRPHTVTDRFIIDSWKY